MRDMSKKQTKSSKRFLKSASKQKISNTKKKITVGLHGNFKHVINKITKEMVDFANKYDYNQE